MRLKVVCVGQKMPDWVDDGVAAYRKRFPREMPLDIVAVPMAPRPGKHPDVARAVERESEQLLAAIGRDDMVVALEVGGQSWSTEKLATRLEDWQMDGRDLVFLVGGPDGLSKACRQRADLQWSLSALTLPHPLVRVILAEQLYRAWTVVCGHPYHRAG